GSDGRVVADDHADVFPLQACFVEARVADRVERCNCGVERRLTHRFSGLAIEALRNAESLELAGERRAEPELRSLRIGHDPAFTATFRLATSSASALVKPMMHALVVL